MPTNLFRLLTLQDHNTRVVMLSVVMLGISGGILGTFLLLRKRSLLSDSISHACLPGVALAFIIGQIFFDNGKHLTILLAGAALSGFIGISFISFLKNKRFAREDAALAITLSLFFGIGIVLLTLIQQIPNSNAAGLQGFIFGKAATITLHDALITVLLSITLLIVSLLLQKELTLLCFDEAFAATQGWPTRFLDAVFMILIVAITVVGLQSVGLLLIVALLIIPSASARFWSNHLGSNLALSASFGACGGFLGVSASALLPKFPTGALVVICLFGIFIVSFIFGKTRGVIRNVIEALQYCHVQKQERNTLH